MPPYILWETDGSPDNKISEYQSLKDGMLIRWLDVNDYKIRWFDVNDYNLRDACPYQILYSSFCSGACEPYIIFKSF
jgi:hypothetical protein